MSNEYSLRNGGSLPNSIATGFDGNLWFTEYYQIGRMTTNSTLINEYTLPNSSSLPDNITPGPDHNLWFTELSGNKIGQITTS